MTFLRDALGFLRFATGLKAFVNQPLTLDDAKALIRRGMQRRHEAFLQKVQLAVFANAKSPYRKLLSWAGCKPGDIAGLVRDEGLEGALRRLHDAGVYVTYDEFKGRAAAIRGSQRFAFREADFDNPLVTPHFHGSSGGSRGRPTRILIDLEHIAQSAPSWALWFGAHDWLERPLLFWTSAHTGIVNRQLIATRIGRRYVRWFATVGVVTLKDRIVAPTVHRVFRSATGCPQPEFVPLSEVDRIIDCLGGLVAQGSRPCMVTSPSNAVRASLAAQQRNVSLRGVTFLLGAEPLTAARKTSIEAAGAVAVPTYGFSEGGNVGSQCPNAGAADDVHVSLDAYAVVQRPVNDGDLDAARPLLLTALRPACPKVLLNTEIGDSAVLETRRCGCLFDEVGYLQHLHTIRSFEKVTGFGVTFAGSDLVRVIEDVLPRAFGGGVTDYQLIERQDARGLPRYTLLVDPSLGPVDERAVAATFLEELARVRSQYRYMVNLWTQSDGILRVERRQPVPTARGKLLPFRTLGPH